MLGDNFPNRPMYQPGGYLYPRLLQLEQWHRLGQLNRHNRHLHGSGVVCGLWVVPADDPKRPWGVRVCPGYAIDCCGRELFLSQHAELDIREYLWLLPSSERRSSRLAYIGIRFWEEELHPVPVQPKGCGCELPTYEASRVQDSSRVEVLWRLPVSINLPRVNLCEPSLPPCPPGCLEGHHVRLAQVHLPASEADPIRGIFIRNLQ